MRSYWDYFDDIEIKFKTLDLKVNTPIIELKYEDQNLIIKDENENLNGSFKDRSIGYQMARHVQQGERRFALSSSGNSAVSACYISRQYNVELQLFLSEQINSSKLNKIKELSNSKININLSIKPRSELIKFLNNNPDFINLRGSTDVYAPVGFKTISYELFEQVPKIDAIFIPCSSGTSSIGINQGFQELNNSVPIHICQTEKINSISKYFDLDFELKDTSLADAITDRVAHRKNSVVELIKETNGFGWIISDTQLMEDKKIINNLLHKDYSFNSLLAFSGWRKAVKKGYNYKYPVLLFSGL